MNLPLHTKNAFAMPVRRAVLASVLVLSGIAGVSACGKSISITDSASSSAPAAPATSAAAPAAPAASAPAAPAGNSPLQVVDQTAAQSGLTGNGGTVVGAAVQQSPPKWVQLSAVQSAQLGTHLIDVNQSTLYRFDKDTAQPSQSNCNDDCAVTWPPVTIVEGGKVYLAGVAPEQVGAIRRQDGQVQVTVGGWPVYRFSGDNGPGDANGQGVGGTWFTVDPTGQKSAH